MLKKENRLTKKNDFDNVFKEKNSFFSKSLIIRTRNNNISTTRFGIVVSAKVSKKAVERNKIKRTLREEIKNNLKNIKKGIDVVIITLPLIKTVKKGQIEKEINCGFKQLNLFKKI